MPLDTPYRELRPRLFAMAYGMVGSAEEAEDIVQDAFVRFHVATGNGTDVESPRAFLSLTTTRLAIDHLRSARVRRERYVGQWLPEPLITGHADHAGMDTEALEALSMPVLVLLERLSPVERAVFVLRDLFGYGFDEIARAVEKSQPNYRQIAARARRHVESARPRFAATPEQRDDLARTLLDAWEEGDTTTLERVLTADVVSYADGGGKAPAAPLPITGRAEVIRLLLGIRRIVRNRRARLALAQVNGDPGVVAVEPDAGLTCILSLDYVSDGVQALRWVLNPDKLARAGGGGRPRRPRSVGQ